MQLLVGVKRLLYIVNLGLLVISIKKLLYLVNLELLIYLILIAFIYLQQLAFSPLQPLIVYFTLLVLRIRVQIILLSLLYYLLYSSLFLRRRRISSIKDKSIDYTSFLYTIYYTLASLFLRRLCISYIFILIFFFSL